MTNDLISEHGIRNALGFMSIYLNGGVSNFDKIYVREAYDIIKQQNAKIAELQKRLDEYEARVERLKKKERDTYTSLAEQYEFGWEKALETAIEIMTGQDEE